MPSLSDSALTPTRGPQSYLQRLKVPSRAREATEQPGTKCPVLVFPALPRRLLPPSQRPSTPASPPCTTVGISGGYEQRADPRRNCLLPSHSRRHSCPLGARADESFPSVSLFLSTSGQRWPRKAPPLPSLVVSNLSRFLGAGKEGGCILRRAGARRRGSRWLGYLPTRLSWLR